MSAKLPYAWGVLYAAPNKDGDRKSCSNCEFLRRRFCDVLGMDVDDDDICGYHVPSGEYADPDVSGYGRVKGGTSCNRCRFYQAKDDEKGLCMAVIDEDGDPAKVEGMGCCARWEAE